MRPRIVLDTNAWLDVLVFRDARAAWLAAALVDGRLEAVADARAADEWRRVVAYSKLGLDPERQRGAVGAFEHRATLWSGPADRARLPRCADPDDQPFLELARDSGARLLVSRDAALLALDRRTRSLGFGIVVPEQVAARLELT
jgi:putative PIN family toxin of toxin-antitoxin system